MTIHYSPTDATYRDITARLSLLGLDTSIPEAVRTIAKQSVAQTRRATDRSIDAFEASVATFEKSFGVAGQRAAAFNRKIIDIARGNMSSSFDLAESLADARTITDMVELQAAFWREQFKALSTRADEVRALSRELVDDVPASMKKERGSV
jgi:hypothetical protein